MSVTKRDETWQREPTEAQVKAVASSTRLRILRLCTDRSRTNKELADRLGLDPSTVLHHVRLLVDAGLLEATGVRQGSSGAYEKPYRSTGLTWTLSFGPIVEDDASGESVMVNAFRAELREAGPESIAEMTRFYLHLDHDALEQFIDRFKDLLVEFKDSDAERRDRGHPAYSGFFTIHRQAPTESDGP
jgi:DNA-binding transcriptional ArsR family regulator